MTKQDFARKLAEHATTASIVLDTWLNGKMPESGYCRSYSSFKGISDDMHEGGGGILAPTTNYDGESDSHMRERGRERARCSLES